MKIRKIGIGAVLGACVFLLCGCASTTVREFDKDGKIVKETECDESALTIIAQSLESKDNIVHASGWAVGVQPTAGIYGAGSFDILAGSVNAKTGAENALSYATMINASQVDLEVLANENGISAKANNNDKAEGGNDTAKTEDK